MIDLKYVYPALHNDFFAILLDMYADNETIKELQKYKENHASDVITNVHSSVISMITDRMGPHAILSVMENILIRNDSCRGRIPIMVKGNIVRACFTDTDRIDIDKWVIIVPVQHVPKQPDTTSSRYTMTAIRKYSEYDIASICLFIDRNGDSVAVSLEDETGVVQGMMDKISVCYDYYRSHENICLPLPYHWMYPNMKTDSGFWESEKQQYAMKWKELTLLWYITPEKRDKLQTVHNIYTYDDPRLCADLVHIHKKTGKILDSIIRINSRENQKLISFTECDIFADDNECIFVDLEFVGDVIYMIGMYHNDDTDFMCLIADDLHTCAERLILREWIDYIRSITRREKRLRLVYWSAEKRMIMKKLDAHGFKEDEKWFVQNVEWFDMCSILKEKQFATRGCFDFKLKSIAKAMFQHGFIQASLPSTGPSNGLDSIGVALSYYASFDEHTKQQIMEYNRFDCLSMYQIYHCMRSFCRIYDDVGVAKESSTSSITIPVCS